MYHHAGLAPIWKTPRERNVGLTNRVISGMLLYQTRTNETNCTDSKFNKIQQTCTGPRTLKVRVCGGWEGGGLESSRHTSP